MRFIQQFILGLFVLIFFGISAFSQETQVKVVDEVVAQINEGVITLSQVRRETKNAVDVYVQEGKTRDEAQKLVDDKQGELIAGLINEELLVQRAKEDGLGADIDAEVNQRQLEVMKQYNLKTVEELYAVMEKSGVDPKEVKDTWRKQIVRDRVLQREVQSKVYWEPNGKTLKEYFEKNKDKFTKPATISFSELFLGFAGRDEAAVKEKAGKLYEQLKAGADFDKIVKENGDTGLITQGSGKVENANVKDLVEKIAVPLKGVKVGGVTAPFELDDLGMVILRVDQRSDASNEAVFDENAVRMAILNERFPEEQKKFMAKLRTESYIKINDTYRPTVSPILFDEERKEKTGN